MMIEWSSMYESNKCDVPSLTYSDCQILVSIADSFVDYNLQTTVTGIQEYTNMPKLIVQNFQPLNSVQKMQFKCLEVISEEYRVEISDNRLVYADFKCLITEDFG